MPTIIISKNISAVGKIIKGSFVRKQREFRCNHVNGFFLIIPSLSPTSETLNYSDKKGVPSNVMEMSRSFPKNVIKPDFLGMLLLNTCDKRSMVDVRNSQQIEPLGIIPNSIAYL